MKRTLVTTLLPALAATAVLAVAAPGQAATAPSAVHHASDVSPAAYPASKVLTVAGDDQDNYYFCGPASVRNALSARGVYSVQSSLAKEMGTDTNGTDSVANVTPVLNKHLNTTWYESKYIKNSSSATSAETNLLKNDILLDTNKGYAIVANIWTTAKDTSGNSHSYPDGHFITVIGYKDSGQTARIYDVASNTYYWMDVHNLATWIAGRGYSA